MSGVHDIALATAVPFAPLSARADACPTAAQILFIESEAAARAPGEHLARQKLARAIALLDYESVLADARWPQVARVLWVAASGLATTSDDFEAEAYATIINAVNIQRWRRSQTPPVRSFRRADIDR